MRRLLRTFLIYIIPTILIVAGIETGLGRINNSYTEKKALLTRQLSTCQVLILGSSLAYRGVDPALIPAPGFNLAYTSQSLFYDRVLLARYAPRMPELRVVIIPIAYFSLEYDLSHSPEYWRCFFYERFWGMPLESNAHALDIQRFSLMKLYGRGNTLKYMRALFHIDLSEKMDAEGSSPYGPDKTEAAVTDDARARIVLHNAIMDPHRVPANTEHLKFILRFLKERRVRPVFLFMPVSKPYALGMDPVKRAETRKIISALSSQEDVPYFDYTSDERFLPEDFQDADHLSGAGARKFTAILDNEVIEPVLNKNPL